MPIDQTFRDAAYPRETAEVFVYLLDIEHDDLDDPIRLTTSEYDLTVGGSVYLAAPFDLQPPGQVEDDPRGRLIVPNVDRRIGEGIDSISTPPTIRIREVLESDPTITFADFQGLRLQEIRGDAESFEGMLGWEPLATEAWPRDIIGPDKYRAVFRMY